VSEVLIIGTGKMGQEYTRLFREGLGQPFSVAGRSSEKTSAFAKSEGAQEGFIFSSMAEKTLRKFESVIVACSEENLEDVTTTLLKSGIKKILLEKPAALSVNGSKNLARLAEEKKAFVRIACNRRYYKSVQFLKNILKSEPAISATFEFAELSKQIEKLNKPSAVKARWGFVNPIHVVDTLTFLLGSFSNLTANQSGQGTLEWHPTGAVFHGIAKSNETAISYSSNWLSPGRWDIQVMTASGRYKLSPMEKLVVMRHDSKFQWIDIELPTEQFKPGIREMVVDFTSMSKCQLPSLMENTRTLEMLSKIFGYTDE
jgi:predicted dehydrogenase